MGRASRHLNPHCEHALGGDSDVHVGRLAGDREVPQEAGLDETVSRPVVSLLGLLIGDDSHPHPDPVLVAQVGERQQEAGERPLHVIGASSVEAVAVEPWLELLGPPGNHVDVAVQQHGVRSVLGPHVGDRDRQVPDADLARHDVTRLEPALDESRAEPDPLGGGGVVADQLLGERALFHHRTRQTRGGCRPGCSAGPPSAVRPSDYPRPIGCRLSAGMPRAVAARARRHRAPRCPARLRPARARHPRGARRRSAGSSASGGTASATSTRARFANTSSQPSPWAKRCVSPSETCRRSSVGTRRATIGTCLARIPTSPSVVLVESWTSSPLNTSRSGVSTWASSVCLASANPDQPPFDPFEPRASATTWSIVPFM